MLGELKKNLIAIKLSCLLFSVCSPLDVEFWLQEITGCPIMDNAGRNIYLLLPKKSSYQQHVS